MERRSITVTGIVQGVGFRPFVYDVATRLGLHGSVWNRTSGVTIEVEGPRAALDRLLDALHTSPPPLARIEALTWTTIPSTGEAGFRIVTSEPGDASEIVIAPDTSTCDACRRELFDPADRRFLYPFLNCTHCGPRLTIVRDVPYDRPRTTMAGFPMCEACRAEYDDPRDRRFHAQPTACAVCGPRLTWVGDATTAADPLAHAVRCLEAGGIVAIKGLGGFHLACDATSASAIATLRERKHREARPFALMVRDLDAARAVAHVGEAEALLLGGRERPIVLLPRRRDRPLPDAIAPGLDMLGLMLPYTPLHLLLMDRLSFPIVLTSGNRSDDPICFRDDDAARELGGIPDGTLAHDRPIAWRCDDSVVRWTGRHPIPIRRSRGYAPRPLPLHPAAPRPLLAFGGHQKNVFCLARGERAILSQHVGDLSTYEAMQSLVGMVEHYRHVFAFEPEAIACDLHPGYGSTRLATEMAQAHGLPLLRVQHHHAHIAAVLAEHGVDGPALGFALDGAGLGDDGTVWGFELLEVRGATFRRWGHLDPIAMPGGDAATREPRRMALAYLHQAFGDDLPECPWLPWRDDRFTDTIGRMLRQSFRSPLGSSAGRLFDAVASLLGVRDRAEFEGQAAMELEAITAGRREEPCALDLVGNDAAGTFRISFAPAIRELVAERARGASVPHLADRFHETVVEAIRRGAIEARQRSGGITRVALGGGTFQNARVLDRAVEALASSGFEVLIPREVPPNDGGLAFGQAAVAAAMLREPVGAREETWA